MIFINRPGLIVSPINQFIIQHLVEYFTANNMAVYTAHIEDILQKQPFTTSPNPDNKENGRVHDFRKKTVELSKQGIKESTIFIGLTDTNKRGDLNYYTALAEINNLHLYFIIRGRRYDKYAGCVNYLDEHAKDDENYTVCLPGRSAWFSIEINDDLIHKEVMKLAQQIILLEKPIEQFDDKYLVAECKKRNISTMYEIFYLDGLPHKEGIQRYKLEKLIADGKLARTLEKLFRTVDLMLWIAVPSSTGIEYNLNKLRISDKMLNDVKKMRKGRSIVYDFTNTDDKTLKESIQEIIINDIPDVFSKELLIERYTLCPNTRSAEIDNKSRENEDIFDRVYDISTSSVIRDRYPKVMNFIRDKLFENGIITKRADSK